MFKSQSVECSIRKNRNVRKEFHCLVHLDAKFCETLVSSILDNQNLTVRFKIPGMDHLTLEVDDFLLEVDDVLLEVDDFLLENNVFLLEVVETGFN